MSKYCSKVFFILLIFSTSVFSQKTDFQDILPVELLYFEGFAFSNGIVLRWGTATEVNNFGFEIQRADTSKIFEYIDFVPGSGNSNSPKHYFYADTTLPASGLYFYRLKQIDYDGTYKLSDTIQVLFNTISVETEKSLSQNRVIIKNNYLTKELEVDFNNEILVSPVVIEIYSILGERIFQRTINNQSNQLKINYSNLSSGVYLLSIKTTQKLLKTDKFIVTR